MDKAKKVQQRISQLEDKVNAQKKRLAGWDDLMVLCEMGNEEEDESLVAEVEEGYQALLQNMESARLETLLSGEYDYLSESDVFMVGSIDMAIEKYNKRQEA